MSFVPAMSLRFCCLIFILALGVQPAPAGPEFPPLTGRVVDRAGLLDDDTIAELTRILEQHERETTNQVVVVTLLDLQGYEIAEYGYQLGRKWQIGQVGRDNGVLLIVALKERKARIEVGYGLEGTLTDAYSHAILQGDILPHFRKGNYRIGILNGVHQIVGVLQGTYKPRLKKKSNKYFYLVGFFLLLLFIMLGMFNNNGGGRGGRRRHRGDYYGAGSGYSSRGWGSFGGRGGFSGGGGSFGGGGASGGW